MKILPTLIVPLLICALACSCAETEKPFLSSITNFRELGGYPAKDGRFVKYGYLLRGAALDSISPEDSSALVNGYHLSRVFDLRSSFEADRRPDIIIANSEYIHLPALDTASFPQPKIKFDGIEDLVIKCAGEKWFQDAVQNMYYSLAFGEYCRKAYSRFLDEIINTEAGAVYWHCSQGKDRTGFGAAMILYALGVDKEVVISDFAKSKTYYEKDVERVKGIVRSNGGDADALNTVDAMIGVSVGNFKAVLDSIDRRFETPEKYLEEWFGVDEKEREILRSRYLTK